jgi:hypothetical protein
VFTTVNKNGKKKRGNEKRIVKISKYHVIGAKDTTKIGILLHRVRPKRMIEQNSTEQHRRAQSREIQNRTKQSRTRRSRILQCGAEKNRRISYLYKSRGRCDRYHDHS